MGHYVFAHRIQSSGMWMGSEGILGIVRNGEGQCSGLLGFLPGGMGTRLLDRETGVGVFSAERGQLGGFLGEQDY